MKRIVVGADNSAGAANAMRWAAHLAAMYDGEVVVMTGFVPAQPDLPADRVEALLEEQRKELETRSESAPLGDLPVRTIVEHGDPRPGILGVADREEADLIVVGRIGQSAGPGLLHIGSMAEWLAHNSDRPVAIIGGAVNTTIRSVLVGVDGSDGSKKALRWVRDLAAATDIRIVAASVNQPYLEWTPATSPKNWRRGVEKQIRDDYARVLTDAGLDFDAIALRGSNAAEVLLQAAKDERVDVVVVGARGRGGFAGLRIGGVALKVLHHADRPVVLVPSEI